MKRLFALGLAVAMLLVSATGCGKKAEKKFYIYHTGYIGGLKQIAYSKMLAEKSDLAVYEAVKGMLPKNSLGRAMIKKLRVYKGAEHKQAAQKPEVLNFD